MWSFLLTTTPLPPLPTALPLLRRPLISHFISSAFRLLQHEISQTTKRKREIQLRKLLGNLLAWKWDKVMCEGGEETAGWGMREKTPWERSGNGNSKNEESQIGFYTLLAKWNQIYCPNTRGKLNRRVKKRKRIDDLKYHNHNCK